jgi:hypothetical protein
MNQFYDCQKAADKKAKRLIKIAYNTGGTVPFSLGRMIDLKCSLKVIRAVLRGN